MGKKLTLKFSTGPIKGQIFTFDEDPEIIIGRGDTCDIVLKDPKMSSEHCGIFFEDGGYFLEDFESTNGTYVNTTKIDEEDYHLADGETLFLGSSKVSISISSAQKKKAPTPKRREEPIQEKYKPKQDEDFDMEEDTNIKKIKKNNGAKKFFDIDFYLDLKEKFMDLEPAKKAIVLFMSLFAVFLLFFISSKLTNDSGKGFFSKSYSDNSEQVYQLGPNVMNKVLGYYKTRAQEDFEHPKKFRLKFRQSKQEKSSIYYSITKTEYLDEVIIKLNGVKIASAPLTSDAIQKVKLALPFENLSFDEDNVLEFINTRNLTSKKFKRWGLLIHKFEKKILPKPDFDKARENYIKADKFYNQRRISRGNRFKAMKYYQVSIDFMELMPANEKPDFYDDSIDKIKEINKSFDEMYSRNKFAIFKAIKFGDIKKAKLHINNIINEIPDEDDPRYNEALELLNRL